jgi:hypothetical protein
MFDREMSELIPILKEAAPCLILLDQVVAYPPGAPTPKTHAAQDVRRAQVNQPPNCGAIQ